MHAMNIHPHAARQKGFSLIEVLVAVVVLSFGLLALAALQGSLFKASAEAKAQSVGLGLAAEKLEYFRGVRTMAEYRAITSGTDPAAIVGGVSYTRAWVVTRCAYPNAGGSFNCTVANTGALSKDPATGFAENNEFKRIVVNVTWTDASNAAQRVSLEDAVAALDPADSAKLGKLSGTTLPRGPEVRIFNPAMQQQGVIPIAIGGGTDTAATNPKPLVNNTSVIETRFDVLTYNGLSGNTAVAQARVQTSVVGCSCDYGNAPTAGAMRPTYWDGKRYTLPETATAVIPGSTPLAGPDASASAQSELCTICCRDHHDPATLPAGAAKFDPRNTNTTTGHSSGHFLLSGTTGAPVLSAQKTSGKFTEACRVIRVGGLFRVAADTYDDYQNFLTTWNATTALNPDGTSKAVVPYLPTDAATTNYQNFVKAYLDARVVNQTAQTAWNNVLPIADVTTVSGLESTHSVYRTQPNQVIFNYADAPKWLHLRGLYIDYLEDKALQAIDDAKQDCVGTGTGGAVTASDLESCVLKVLPFTSINLTELGIYSPLSGNQIVVSNANFYDTLGSTAPIRGKVSLGSNPTNGTATNGVANMRRSNSGLTTLIGGIDAEDATSTPPSTWTARQPYVPQGVPSGGNGGLFYVNLSGYPFAENANTPSINDSVGATCNYLSSTTPNYVCTSPTMNAARTVTFGKYNFSLPTSQTGLTLNCNDTDGLNTISHTFSTAQSINVCRNFQVTGSDHNGALGTVSTPEGVLGETTPVAYATNPLIKDADVLNVSFTEQTPSTQSYTCSYNAGTTPAADTDFSVTPAACP
jgi:type IV pilus modification protein PilV